MATVGEYLAAYRKGLAENAGKPGRLNGHVEHPNYGFTIQVVVADTDAEARRLAEEAHRLHHESFTYLWKKHGDEARHAARADFDTYVGQGLLTYGSPDTVRSKLQEYLDVTGANYVGSVFTFGSLTHEEVMRSMHLYREQVMPKLFRRELAEVPA
jgi:alkanesulfonate monooxygenase SsuD/methylene tetrahydromethanopterin reductase-like flavin-dependent oxidoreductase (luciferase family)